MHRLSKPRNLVETLWSAKGAIVLSLAAILLPACASEQATTSASPGNVTTEEVTDKTNQLLGKTVTIRSEPIRKIGLNSFTVNDEQFFGSESILVVNASGKPFTLPTDPDVEVQVTGEVRKFVFTNYRQGYNLDPNPEIYREYEGKPAIIAQSIALAPEPGEITKNPSQYYGKALAVTGEVEAIQSPNAFTLDEDQLLGATDLLVLRATPANQQAAIKDGETVAVTGVLRPLVLADLERDYDLTWNLDLQRKLEAEYREKPVLVADAVYPSAIPEAAK